MMVPRGGCIALLLLRFLFVWGDMNGTEQSPSAEQTEYLNASLSGEYVFDDDERGSVNLTGPLLPEEGMGSFSKSDGINDTMIEVNDTIIQVNDTDFAMNSSRVKVTGCNICAKREDERKYRLNALKNHILDKLHLHSPPNMSGRTLPKVPRFSRLIERSEYQSDSPEGYHDNYEYDELHTWHTERVFTIAKAPPIEQLLNVTTVSYFTLPEELKNSKIKKAILWYYMRPAKQQKTVVEVNIHRLKPSRSPEDPIGKLPLRYWKLFPKKARNWHQLDIRDTVQEWVDRPYLNYGLQLTAFDHTRKNLIINPPTSPEDEGYEPMVEIKAVRKIYTRKRRSALRCSANSTETRCCRHPLHVNFLDFGWDWVIAPRSYWADYCAGECRFAMQDDNEHSYIQQHATGIGPCCTPTLLSELSMLYFDGVSNIIMTNLQNMKVERCGCA